MRCLQLLVRCSTSVSHRYLHSGRGCCRLRRRGTKRTVNRRSLHYSRYPLPSRTTIAPTLPQTLPVLQLETLGSVSVRCAHHSVQGMQRLLLARLQLLRVPSRVGVVVQMQLRVRAVARASFRLCPCSLCPPPFRKVSHASRTVQKMNSQGWKTRITKISDSKSIALRAQPSVRAAAVRFAAIAIAIALAAAAGLTVWGLISGFSRRSAREGGGRETDRPVNRELEVAAARLTLLLSEMKRMDTKSQALRT